METPTMSAIENNAKRKVQHPGTSESQGGDGKFHFSIDRGGTFTDVHVVLPDGSQLVTKLLSEDPANYPDAPTEGIRRVLDEHEPTGSYPRGTPVNTTKVGSIRMGTTVATNALLERKGERMGLLITRGFRDLLRVGNQSRPDIFDLTCKSPGLLYERVVEIDERVMLSSFYDEGKSEEELAMAATASSDSDGGGAYPSAGVGARYQGVTGERVIVLRKPDLKSVKVQLQGLADIGIQSIAVVLAHS